MTYIIADRLRMDDVKRQDTSADTPAEAQRLADLQRAVAEVWARQATVACGPTDTCAHCADGRQCPHCCDD